MWSFEVLTCHGADAARWQSFSDRLPVGVRDVQFSPAYYRIQELAGGGGRCAVYCWDDYFIMQPFVLRLVPGHLAYQDITSPYGFGGPVSNLDGFALATLWQWFDQEFADWRKAERVVSEYCALSPMAERHQTRMLQLSGIHPVGTRDVAIVRVDQTDEAILAGADESRRQLIRRAGRDGIKAAVHSRSLGFGVFYEFAMRRKAAVARWRYSAAYFEAHDQLMPERAARIAVGSHCTAIVLLGGRTAHYHFAARGDSEAQGSGELLVMEACRLARRSGAQWLNLGGGLTADPQDSLWRYKASWTPHRAPVRHYTRIFDQEAYGELCYAAGLPLAATSSGYTGWFPAYRAGESA